MKVLVSNQLSILSDALYEKLFEASPLEKQWLIVQSEEMKLDLYLRWLKKRDVITAIQTLTYKDLVRKIFPQLPCQTELKLRIETALDRIQQTGDLKLYLKEGHLLRKLDLADEMSSLFLKYLRQPPEKLLKWLEAEGWQQRLWKEVFGKTLPIDQVRPLQGSFFFYHVEELTPYEWNVFSELKSWWFLFSPSQMYLGDFQTQRQQLYLLRQAKGGVREELSHYFEQDSPLLSNWGAAGRGLFRFFEEAETEELFVKPSGSSALKNLQIEWLTLEQTEKKKDLSLQLHSAPSLLREVEVVWEIIQRLPHEPQDIVVFAPDIQPYASAIEWVFKERGSSFDYTIIGIEAKTHSVLLQGFETLITLSQFRFSRELFAKLLLNPPFLKRFSLSLEEAKLLHEWMKEAHLRCELKEGSGSWEAALKRTVEALIQENDSISIDFTDISLINRWIEITRKLEQTLEPTWDLKPRSAPWWADWIETVITTFFVADEGADLLNSILAPLRNERVEGLFLYPTIERLLLSTIKSRSGSIHRSKPQAVRFSSLNTSTMTAAKTIIVMGMQEGSFPRLDPSSSLPAFSMPNQAEKDRYLFLEALAQAQDSFMMTYSRCHPEDGKEMHPSSLVEELAKDRGGIETFHHPSSALDPSYYQPAQFHSFSSLHYKLLSAKPSAKETRKPLPSVSLKSPIVDLRLLKKLARHPVQCFFEASLGLRFTWKETDPEFLFSPLEMHRLRASSLHFDIDDLIQKLDRQGKLPTGSFRSAALQSIEKDLTHYHQSLDQMGVDPATIFTIEMSPYCQSPINISSSHRIVPALQLTLPSGDIKHLQGTLEGITENGLLFHGDDSLEDLLKVWPLYCVSQALLGQTSLFLTKKGISQEITIDNPIGALERYVDYLQKNLCSPSPLLPSWGRRILKGGAPPTSSDDEVIAWAEKRDLLPAADQWADEWRSYLQGVVHELI